MCVYLFSHGVYESNIKVLLCSDACWDPEEGRNIVNFTHILTHSAARCRAFKIRGIRLAKWQQREQGNEINVIYSNKLAINKQRSGANVILTRKFFLLKAFINVSYLGLKYESVENSLRAERFKRSHLRLDKQWLLFNEAERGCEEGERLIKDQPAAAHQFSVKINVVQLLHFSLLRCKPYAKPAVSI